MEVAESVDRIYRHLHQLNDASQSDRNGSTLSDAGLSNEQLSLLAVYNLMAV